MRPQRQVVRHRQLPITKAFSVGEQSLAAQETVKAFAVGDTHCQATSLSRYIVEIHLPLAQISIRKTCVRRLPDNMASIFKYNVVKVSTHVF